jgi:hypothetical protein
MHVNEVLRYVGDLVRTQRIRPECREGETYFLALTRPTPIREDPAGLPR